MLNRYHKLIAINFKFYSSLPIAKTKAMNQGKCYFRHIEDEEKVDINFLFKLNENSIRQFNLSRKPSEVLDNIITRISSNIQKFSKKTNKKKKGNEDSNILDIHFLDKDDKVILGTKTCNDLFSMESQVKLKISDITLEAVFNPPWILSVNLPKSILAGFPVYPEYLSTQFTEQEFNTFNWYKGQSVNDKGNVIGDQHVQWMLVSTGFMFTPSASDVGMKLKLECIPGNSTSTGPIVEVVSTTAVEAGPGDCPFELRHKFTTSKLQFPSFRCVTYNILADLYCDSDFTRTSLHPYCPPYALHIDYRKQLVIKELLGYNADLICLQEVDNKIFKNCLVPILSVDGLEGQFYKKAKEVAEGLACFYRRDRFRLLSQDKIVLSDAIQTLPCFASIWSTIQGNEPLLERLLNRSTVASATILESVEDPHEILIVGNTHLYFHPDADHIRLIQGGMCIYWLQDMLKTTKAQMSRKKVSVILCGDFNSVPSCGIYQLYTTGIAPSTLPDWQSNVQEAVQDLTLQQKIIMESACGTPEFTNYTVGFADCLDYIFYDKSMLEVEQVVPLPSIEELTVHTALPSIVFPSDHISLISDLTFKQCN